MPRKPSAKALARRAGGLPAVVAKPDQGSFIASTVRPGDEYNQYARQQTHLQLVGRYGGDVKALSSGNGAGVASTPLRVMRRKSGRNGKSAFDTRPVSRKRREWIATGGGLEARKSMGSVQEDVEEVTDPLHPLVKLLTDANARDDQFSLMEGTQIAVELTGNAYWMLAYNDGADYPTELWPLKPQYVRVVPSRTEFISAYTYGAGYEVEQTFPVENVVHFRSPSPRSDYYGEGCLQACLIHADISFDLACFWKATLDNACQPGLIISGPGVTETTRAGLQEAVDRKYRGVRKAAITAILAGELKIEQWQMKEADFSHITGSDQVTKMMCRAFDTPVEKLEMRPGGLSDSGNAVERQWQRWAILPRCRRIENVLNAKLVPIFREALRDDGLFVAFDNPVDVDEAALVDRAVKLFAANLYDRDRALGLLSEDAVDGEPVYMIDLTTNGAIAQSAAAQPIQDAEATVTEDDDADANGGLDNARALPGASAGADVQATALNGAQVTALTDLVARVAAGELPLEAVKPMMLISYPNTPEAQIDALIKALTGFEAPKPEPVAPPPVQGGGPDEGGGGTTPPTKARGTPAHAHAPTAAAPSDSMAVVRRALWAQASANSTADGDGRCKHYPHFFDPIDIGDGTKDDKRDKFADALEQWFKSVAPYIQDQVRRYVESGMIEPIRNILAGDPEQQARFIEVVSPFTRESMMAGNLAAVPELAATGHQGEAEQWVDVPPSRAVEWLRSNDVRLAESTLETIDARVRDTVGRTLSDAVGAGLEQGDTVTEIQNRVAEVMGPTSSRYAAERIARTESARALSAGRDETYRESGEVVGYEWLPSGDPCPLCVDLIGKVVPVGTPFAVDDYGPVYFPPRHPGCACDYTPKFAEPTPMVEGET